MTQRILVVAAHPDDEALGCGGSMARWSAEGKFIHVAFIADAVVTVLASLVTKPKSDEELRGLVWGLAKTDPDELEDDRDKVWWRSPILLGAGALILVVVLNIVFI